MEENQLLELSIEEEGSKITLKKAQPSPIQNITPITIPQSIPLQSLGSSSHANPGSTVSGEETKKLHEIKSPLVGTFYRSPKPGAPPFVNVKDKITKGQTLCIIEAMKVMNEIKSDVDGEIVEICVKDAESVDFGRVLFRVEVS